MSEILRPGMTATVCLTNKTRQVFLGCAFEKGARLYAEVDGRALTKLSSTNAADREFWLGPLDNNLAGLQLPADARWLVVRHLGADEQGNGGEDVTLEVPAA